MRIALSVETGQLASGFSQGLRLVSQFVTGSSAQLNKLAGVFDKIASNAKFAGPLGLALGAVALAMGLALGPAIRFESAMTGVSKTVDGTPAQIANLRSEILGMSQIMPIAATEIAGVAEAAGQLGVGINDVAAFTETMVMLGTATDLTAESAAVSMAQFANSMGLPVSDVDSLAASLVYLGNNSATTEATILTMSQRLGGAGKAFGLTGAEVMALSASLLSVGINAEAGSTVVVKVFTEMTKVAEMGGKKLKTFAEVAGVLPEVFADMVKAQPTEALDLFVKGLGTAEERGISLVQVLDDLGLDGARASSQLQILAAGGVDLATAFAAANGAAADGTALIDEYGRFAETTASRIAVFKGELNALAISVGSVSLDAFASGVDTASAAVHAISDILGPAAAEIAEFSGGVAGAGVEILGFFGSPVLQVAGALLLGVSLALQGVFEALNALGPLAEYTAAAVGLFFLAWKIGVLNSVGPAIVGMLGNMVLMGPAAGAAAAGITILNAAMAASPLIIVAAGLVALGAAYHSAGQAADEAASAVADKFNRAVEAGDYAAIKANLSTTRSRMNELAGSINDAGFGLGDFGRMIQYTGELLPLVDNSIINNRAELNALRDEYGSDAGFKQMTSTIDVLAESFNVSQQSMYATVESLGLLDLASDGTAESLIFLYDEVNRAVAGHEAFADATGVTVDAIRDGSATLQDYGDELGITGDQVEYLVNQLDDVDIKDLFDEEEAARASAAVALLNIVYGELAASVGITRQRFIEQRQSSDDLVASLGALDAATSRITDRQAALQKAMSLAAEGQTAFNTALTTGDFEGAAVAMGEYTTALASSGVSANDVKSSQIDMRAAFEETAKAAGLSTEEIGRLLVEYGLLSEQEIAELSIAGLDLIDEAITIIADLQYGLDEAFSREYIAQISAETGIAEEDIARAIVLGEDWATSLFEAAISGDPADANRAFQEALAAGQEWALSIFAAALGLDADEAEDKIEGVRDQLGDLSSDQFATVLGLDTDEATRLLEAFLNSIPTSRTVSIAVGVNGPQQYKPDVSYSADGNIFEAYRNGGLRESHVAQIAQGRTPYRVWAEPETGGEAYIPLSPLKRARSIPIWRETGKRLGVSSFADGGLVESFANGGMSQAQFSSSVNLPTISLLVSVDTDALGALSMSLAPAASSITLAGDALENATNSGNRLHDVLVHTVPIFFDAGQAADELNDGLANLPVEFDATTTAAERTGRAMLESLRPDEFLSTFSRISGWAENELVSWLGPWDRTVADALRSLDAAGLEMGHIFTAVADEGSYSAQSMYDAFASAGGEMTRVAQETGREMLLALDTDAFLATFSRISGWASDSFVEWLGDWDGTVADAIRILDDAGEEMGHIFTTMFEEGASATDILLAGLSDVARATGEVEDAARDAATAYGLLSDVALDGLQSQFDYLDAVERVTKSIGEGEAFDKLSRATRRNYEDLIRAGEAMADYGISIAESGASADDAVQAYNDLRAGFVDLATAAGLPQDEVQTLADLLFSLPEQVIAEIAVEGQEARTELDEVKRLLGIFDETTSTAVLEVDADEARTAIIMARLDAVEFATEEYEAALTADPTPAEQATIDAAAAALEFALEEYEAALTADSSGAETSVIRVTESTVLYADGHYEADIDADPTNAVEAGLTATQKSRLFADGSYLAYLDGNNTNAIASATAAQTKATGFATSRYNATLTATDSASSVVGQAIRNLAGFASKNVTLTTTYKTVGTPSTYVPPKAGDGGVRYSAAGNLFSSVGSSVGDFANGHLPEIVPGGTWRVWGEDETGGEAYLPLANDWRRPGAVDILGQVADHYGFGLHQLAAGGISHVLAGNQRTTSIAPIINISAGAVALSVEVPLGADAKQVADIAKTAVTDGLNSFTRDLADVAGSYR